MRLGLYGAVAAGLAAVVITFSVVALGWRVKEGRSVRTLRSDPVVSSDIAVVRQ